MENWDFLNEGIKRSKISEKAAKYSDESFVLKKASQILYDFIYTVSLNEQSELKVEWLSDSFSKTTGYNQEKYLETEYGWLDIIFEEDRPEYLRHLENIKKSNIHSSSVDYRILTSFDEVIWIRDVIRETERNGSTYFIGAVKDVTEEKLYEQAYKQSEERYQMLFEKSGVPVTYYSPDFSVMFANSKAAEEESLQLVELVNRPIDEVYTPSKSAKLKTCITEVMKTEKGLQEEEQELKGEVSKWYSVTYYPVRDLENNIIAIQRVAIDITKRIEQEEKIRINNKELSLLNSDKDKLFSIIAHDLKSPFIALLGFSEFIVDEVDNLTQKEIKDFSLTINRSAKSIFNLLENLLQWSRIASGKIPYAPSRFKLNGLVEDIVCLFTPLALEKKIDIQINLHQDELMVFAEKNMLESIFRNLISNAIKFSFNKGVITIGSYEKNNELIVSVKDMGVGMCDEIAENLFNSDINNTTVGTNNERGSGLGLLLCKELIEKNKGKIWVESKPNLGSTFYFSLPANKHN